MKKIKRSLGIALSVVLLLSFSVTIIPLDFFHNHKTAETKVVCVKDTVHSSCTHKLEIKKQADFCWACAVHFDKSFTKISFIEKLKLSPGISLFINNDTAGYIIELLFTGLRGPPTE